jgi:hypothetical protein
MLRWGNDPIISNLPETVLMSDTFRAMCAEPLAQEAYVAFVQICKGGSDDAGTYDADEAIVRRALKRLDELEGALLAQPEPEGLTDGELAELVAEQLPILRLRLEAVVKSSRSYDGYSTMTPVELTDKIIDAVLGWIPSITSSSGSNLDD